MFQRCILHIGTEKTGTTSIQRFLTDNRKALAQAGYFLPRHMGQPEQFELARAVVTPQKRFGKLRHMQHSQAKIEDIQAKLRQRIHTELQAANGYHSCIISSERLGAQITTPAAIEALRGLLTPYFAQIEVWIYLRPQAAFASSFYSTELRLGSQRQKVLPDLRRAAVQHRFDYAALLAFWRAGLPDAQLHPQIFERDLLKDGDVIADFMDKIGFDIKGLAMPRPENPSFSAAAQIYLRAVNEACAKGAPIDRPRLLRLMNKHCAGKGRLPVARSVRLLETSFAASNEAVRARYFPHRETLFASKAAYPKRAPNPTLLPQDYLALVQILSRKPAPMGDRTLLQAVMADRGLRLSPLGRLRRWLRDRLLR